MEKGSHIDMKIEEDKEEEVIPRWKPALITGGKGPPTTNWLRELNKECIFLAKPRDFKGFEVTEYRIVCKYIKCALLRILMPDRDLTFHVDMNDFSRDMELVEVIGQEDE